MLKTNGRLYLRMLAVVFCAFFAFLPFLSQDVAMTAEAKSLSQIQSELNAEQLKLDSKNKELQASQNKLSSAQSALLSAEEKRDLQQQEINLIDEKIRILDGMIQIYFEEINRKNDEIDALTKSMQKSFDIFCKRLTFIHESGGEGYLDFLFNSGDFSDFLSRGEIMNDFLQYDKNLIDGLLSDYEYLQTTKDEVKLLKQESEAKMAEYENQTILLYAKLDVYNGLVADLEAAYEAVEGEFNQLKQDEKELKEHIAKLENDRDEAIKHQEQIGGPTGNTTPGLNNRVYQGKRFPNPLSGSTHYKSQPFNRGHGGVDLATYGKSVPIKAAASGTVIEAKYHYSWGYFVKISHGDMDGVGKDVYTLYAHMISMPSVSVGQKVSQGTVLGYTGNTGNSYGIHLHFELYVGGSSTLYRVNPEAY